ncbi:hypothetical protein NDU88_001485 [Pleurodeles waltl]|uniref:Uncharacterized protein n=1 Tax=Pleurodeles waltl TaxID=8319 RepID=A0AAV7KWE4_PLEWA|nr:hypothetical protein NDU88_001485 [Pleurodeles waltl]
MHQSIKDYILNRRHGGAEDGSSVEEQLWTILPQILPIRALPRAVMAPDPADLGTKQPGDGGRRPPGERSSEAAGVEQRPECKWGPVRGTLRIATIAKLIHKDTPPFAPGPLQQGQDDGQF